MIAKAVGIVIGLTIFLGYFEVIGTRPAFTTVFGVALATLGGVAAWQAVARWIGGGGRSR